MHARRSARTALLLALGLPLLAVCASAQGALAQVAPAASGPITIEELNGLTVTAVLEFSRRLRKDGVELAGTADLTQHIAIGPGGALTLRAEWAPFYNGKRQPTRNYDGKLRIGQVDSTPDQDGAKSVVWLFESNTLTQLRTFDVGGRKTTFTLARGGNGGYTCKASAADLKEMGAGASRTAGWEILSSRFTSATCQVTRR